MSPSKPAATQTGTLPAASGVPEVGLATCHRRSGEPGVAVLLRLRRRTLALGCGPPCSVGLTGCAWRTLHGLGLLEMFSTADDVPAAMP